MAEVATIVFNSERLRTNGSSPLGEPVDFDVKGLGGRLPLTDAPEGWIKKVERRRQGKLWVGFFHIWVTDTSGRRIRQKKEKTLGPAFDAEARGTTEAGRALKERQKGEDRIGETKT